MSETTRADQKTRLASELEMADLLPGVCLYVSTSRARTYLVDICSVGLSEVEVSVTRQPSESEDDALWPTQIISVTALPKINGSFCPEDLTNQRADDESERVITLLIVPPNNY